MVAKWTIKTMRTCFQDLKCPNYNATLRNSHLTIFEALMQAPTAYLINFF